MSNQDGLLDDVISNLMDQIDNLKSEEKMLQEKASANSMDFGPASCVAFGDKITANDAARGIFKTALAFMLNYNHVCDND